MKTITTLLISLLFIYNLSHAQLEYKFSHNIAKKITEIVKPFEDVNLFSGVILVANDKEIFYNKPFGFENFDDGVKNSAHTRFGIASITKSFTTIILQSLVEENKLALDDKVEDYILGFPRWSNGVQPTIRNLLEHKSGVPHRVTNDDDEKSYLDPKEVVELIKKAGLEFEPDTQSSYSSAGYTALARVIELVENKPFHQVLQIRLFDKAGMESAIDVKPNSKIANSANPYRITISDKVLTQTDASGKNLGFLAGAGSVYATTEDMLHFIIALKNGQIGNPSDWSELMSNEREWLAWSGRTNNYWSYVDYNKKENLVFIMLTNLGAASNWQLRTQIRNLLTNNDVENIPLPPKAVDYFEPPSEIVGNYDNNGRVAEISYVQRKLFRGDNEFYPIEENKYYIPASGSEMRFKRDEHNKIIALVQYRGDNEVLIPKIQ